MALVAAAAVITSVSSSAEARRFRSPQHALEQGLSAYKGGYYELAIPALEEAAGAGLLEARYVLARIYADSRSAHTSHAKAYGLFLRITEDLADVDPDDQPEAEFFAKSLVAVAGYWLRGLDEIGVRMNPKRAAEYLSNAASVYSNEDAQFELAKLHLLGEGVQKDVRHGIHWLSTLTQANHAGAQAFLAELYWKGQHVERNPALALALVETAVRNAPDHERLWIEGAYQTIYCGAPTGVRRQADGLVADFKRRFAQRPSPDLNDAPAMRATRRCESGELVPIPADGGRQAAVPTLQGNATGEPRR